MKKGFTLIELLAVIVILAIIALIAVPIVLSIIEETKESATLRSVEYYLDAVEQSIMKKNLSTRGSFSPNTCEIQSDGKLVCDGTETLELEISGEFPSSGTITFNKGKIIEASLTLSNKTIVKNSDGNLVYQEAPTVPTLASCKFKEGTEKAIGAKYECDFGDGKRKFYILELGSNKVEGSTLESDEVALILEGNYDTTTQAWCASGNDNSCKADGLASKLDEIAEAWKELEKEQIALPSAIQVATADGKIYPNISTISSINAWLYNWPDNADYAIGETAPYGYWTSTPFDDLSDRAWSFGNGGRANDGDVGNGYEYGVRPVVNLKI